MLQLTETEFEQCVEEAMDRIPQGVFDSIDNVYIEFLDDPLSEHLALLAPGCTLLGLYRGTPKPSRALGYGLAGQMPDHIWIFRNSIKRVCRTREEVVEQIRKTMMHEIGHHNGMTDEQLRARGY